MTRGPATQIRSFGYDAQFRLQSATNPESGTVTYSYNANGTLLHKIDAKNQKTAYVYDSFRRVKEVNRHPVAANPPDPCQSLYMYYDYPVITDQGVGTYTWGRLSGVEWGDPTACPGGVMTEGYNYSVSGLVLTKRLQVEKFLSAGYPNSVGMLTAYWTYDNEGRMTQEWYPDDGTIFQYNAPVYTYTFDGMKRPVKLTSAGVDWAKDVVYGPASEMTEMKFLLPGGGYYTEARTYNERMQLRTLTATGAGAPSVNLEYRYSLTQNNGQITQMKDWISGEEVTYQYDTLSRLISAVTTGPEWGLSFTYDGFGNKTQQTVTKGSGPNFSAAVDGLTNRLVGGGYTYDANGNLTSMGTYDVANRLQGSGNVYGPRNERIMKGGSGEVNFYSPDGRRMGAYQMIVSYGVIGFNQIRTNVYFAGKLIREANEAVVLDRLGSVRVRGSQTMNYYPYGEERTTTPDNYTKFGTYFRDAPGLDYADQRYYSNVQGRFLTPDQSRMNETLEDPSSLNQYAYVNGDPANDNDPTGEGFWSSWVGAILRGTIPVFWFGFGAQGPQAPGPVPPAGLGQQVGPGSNSAPTWMGFNKGDGDIARKAWNQARQWVKKEQCDHALTSYGVKSLGDALNKVHFDGSNQNVWNGRNSQYRPGFNTPNGPSTDSVADYFNRNKTSVGAIVTRTNFGAHMFLGYAFFSPEFAGVKPGYSDAARALMMLHEAVHLLGPQFGDAQFGSSKNLTNLIIDKCFPIIKNNLGGLVQ